MRSLEERSKVGAEGNQHSGGLGLSCYVLAKNEEANIERCLVALAGAGVPVVVLDSHSTDGTARIARELGATVEEYNYTSHVDALDLICGSRTLPGDTVMVLDADMVVSAELVAECRQLLMRGDIDVVAAPIQMYWNGAPLRWGSLGPPKPIVFRGGKSYFEPVGHGECLRKGTRMALARNCIVHNDLKTFAAYLDSQVRYSNQLVERARTNRLSLRDNLRGTPLMMLAVPFVSYLLRGGIWSGKTGLGYAVDRLIAEAIMFRQRLAAGAVDSHRKKK